MFGWQDFAAVVLAPALAALATFVACERIGRRSFGEGSKFFGPAGPYSAAVIAGMLDGFLAAGAKEVGFSAALGRVLRPTEALGRIPELAMIAGLVTFVGLLLLQASAKSPRLRNAVQAVVGLLAAAAVAKCFYLLFQGGKYLPPEQLRAAGFAADAWTGAQTVAILGGLTAAVLLGWLTLLLQPRAEASGIRSTLLVGVVLAAALTAALTGSFVYGQALAMLAASLAGAGIAARLQSVSAGPEAAAGPVSLVLGGLLALCVAYSATPLWQAVALYAAAIVAAGWLPRRDTWLRIVLTAALAGGVVAVGATDFVKAQRQSHDDQRPPWASAPG